MLSKHLNFRFEMKAYTGNEPPSPGSWTLMVHGVHRREVDWGIGFVSTSRERLQLVDFTTALVTDGFGILYSFPSNNFLEWHCIVDPFQVSLWALCVSMLFIYTYILQKVAQIELGSSPYGSYVDCLLVRIVFIFIGKPYILILRCHTEQWWKNLFPYNQSLVF